MTRAQNNVARLIPEGLSNKAIGAKLGISAGTVKQHLERIFLVFGARNRTELAAMLVRKGVVE